MRKLILTILSCVFMIIILELVSPNLYQYVFKEKFNKKILKNKFSITHENENEYYRVAHPYLGFTDNPRLYGAKVNKHGLYGEDIVFKKAEDEYVVAITGGSVAYHVFVNGAKKIEKHLSIIPQLANKKIKIVSLAVPGYKQPQQLFAILYLLLQGYKFDLIINLDGFNETAVAINNYRTGVAPIFPMDWEIIAAKNISETNLAFLRGYLDIKRKQAFIKTFNQSRLFSNSNFILTISTLVERHLEARKEVLRRTENHKNLLQGNDKYGVGINSEYHELVGPISDYNEDELLTNLVDIWEYGSEQMKAISMVNHSLYFHFLQPNQYITDSKHFSILEKERYIDEGQYYFQIPLFRKGYDLLIKRAEKLKAAGVNFTDLRFVFKDVKEILYVDSCCHVSARGSELIAEAIARTIENYFKNQKNTNVR